MQGPTPTGHELLTALGFTELEAEVYQLLLQEDPLTGYKIGKKLGRPTANVYKALDSLARKGAVLAEDQPSSQCQAVPIAEFCALVEARTRRQTAAARQAFDRAKPETRDERSYQIQSVDLVLERARRMLAGCEQVAMLDVFPKAAALLKPDLETFVGRGGQLFLQVYEPLEIADAQTVLIDLRPELDVLAYWGSQQLNLITDGQEHLLALLSDDLRQVFQATWSRNLYLSSMLHMGFSNHYTVARIRQLAPGAGYAHRVQTILQQQSLLSNGSVPAVGNLLVSHGLR